MITGNQLHAARVLAGLSRNEAAQLSGIDPDDLSDLEGRGRAGINGRAAALKQVMKALTRAGVEFIDSDGPGVRLRRLTDEALPVEELTTENDV